MTQSAAAAMNEGPNTRGLPPSEGGEVFRLLVEAVSDYAIFLLDAEGRVASWNTGAERIKGYKAEDIIGKHFSCFYPPEAIANRWPEHELKVAAEEGRFEDEGWRLRKDGSRFWANVVITALHNDAGEFFGFCKVTRDMTERRRGEERIQRLNAELSQRLVELAEVNHSLAQKSAENEMFVYGVSHDIRSPLVNLQGFSGELEFTRKELKRLLAESDLPPPARERALALIDIDLKESVHFISTAAMHIAAIVDGLLRLARVGHVAYQCQSVNVHALVERIVASLRSTFQEHGAQVMVHSLPPAWGDAAALEQLFGNLIANAVNYLDPRRPGVIEIGALPYAQAQEPATRTYNVYYVKDNGLGIPESVQHKLFRTFQRFHPDSAKGHGIGLTVVRRIVEQHHGKVWVESAEGRGSTFFVSLPVSPTMPSPAPEAPATIVVKGERRG